MKSTIVFNFRYLYIVFLAGLFSCTYQNNTTIGFLIPASTGYRWPTDQKYLEKAAKEAGARLITKSAENDENLQLKQAEELLKEGIDILIVVPVNSNSSAGIVRDAHKYNVPVIGYDRLIRNSNLDYLVTYSGAKIGKLMVDYVVSQKPEGNYVLLWGDSGDVNAHSIKEEQEKLLKPYISSGKINIVYKAFIENWSSENAYFTMKKILSLTDQKIDAVITSYDGIALGASKAMEEFGLEKEIILTGQDAEIQALHSILDGKMNLTVYKSIKEIAETVMDLSIHLAKNEKIKEVNGTINNGRTDVPTIFLNPKEVTKNTIMSTVIADGFYTEHEVYGNR